LPDASVEEEKTEEAPAKETSTVGETPAEEEASTAGKTPTIEEETSVGQAGTMAAPPPEALGMNNERARASPQRPVAATTPARGTGGDTERGTAPSSTRGPAMDLGEPSGVSWALELVGGPTGREPLCAAAIQAAQRCLDKLSANLAAEEERLDAERACLTEAWGKLHEVVETSHKVDEAVRLRHEEARREAKEIRASAATEAEEILAEAQEKLAEVETHEEALAPREKALAARENAAAAREGEVSSKLLELKRCEEETARHEGSLELRENELRTERSHLKTLESQRVLVVDKASYDERVNKANARLAEKEKEAREQNAKKLVEDLKKVREEFHAKAKS
jgi:hypothetical protein